jgi:hypothetical protein
MGCKHTRHKDNVSAGTEKKSAKKAVAAPGETAKKTPRVVPVNELAGKIASVNPSLRYVVVDFYSSQVPKIDQRMSVYRQGQKIGEIKITGPELSHNIAADIIAGDAKVGDEVRLD